MNDASAAKKEIERQIDSIQKNIDAKQRELSSIESTRNLVSPQEAGLLDQQAMVVRSQLNSLVIQVESLKSALGSIGSGSGNSGAGNSGGGSSGGSGSGSGSGNSDRGEGGSKDSGKDKGNSKDSGKGSSSANVKVKNIMPGSTGAGGGAGSRNGDKVPSWKYILMVVLGGAGIWISRISQNDSLLTYLCFILLFGAIFVSIFLHSRIGTLLIIVLLVASLWFFWTYTYSQIVGAFESGKAQEASAQTAKTAESGVSGIIEQTQTAWNQQKNMATGDYIEGDVDKTIQQTVGIELLDPYLKNPTEISEGEPFEISARLNAFNPKQPLTIGITCNAKTREVGTTITQTTVGGKVDFFPGIAQIVEPAAVATSQYTVVDKDLTCYPKETCDSLGICGEISCGEHYITLSAEADRIRTDASLQNYIMSADIAEAEVRNYAEENLMENADGEAILKKLHPEVRSFVSLSDKGAIKVLIETERSPLLRVSATNKLKLRIGIENAMDGWIREVNSVHVELPDHFKPVTDMCTGWSFTEGTGIDLNLADLNLELNATKKGQQKLFPSCMLDVVDPDSLRTPVLATFLAAVDYNYVVQKKYSIKVRNETGGLKCPAATEV